METKVEMLPAFIALCEQEQVTPETLLRCFMRDVLAVFEGTPASEHSGVDGYPFGHVCDGA
jgi:hypothetical protein